MALFKGTVQKTQMAQDFNDKLESYDKYKALVDELCSRFEEIVQQSPTPESFEYPKSEHPLEKLADSLVAFRTFVQADKASTITAVEKKLVTFASIHRDIQVRIPNAISILKGFKNKEYTVLVDERRKLEKTRDHMDNLRHDLKQAKTTEQVERKACVYELAVSDFDQQADKVIQILNQLPNIQKEHQKDINEFFSLLKKYNESVLQASK